jgi:hypothetical protein
MNVLFIGDALWRTLTDLLTAPILSIATRPTLNHVVCANPQAFAICAFLTCFCAILMHILAQINGNGKHVCVN